MPLPLVLKAIDSYDPVTWFEIKLREGAFVPALERPGDFGARHAKRIRRDIETEGGRKLALSFR